MDNDDVVALFSGTVVTEHTRELLIQLHFIYALAHYSQMRYCSYSGAFQMKSAL